MIRLVTVSTQFAVDMDGLQEWQDAACECEALRGTISMMAQLLVKEGVFSFEFTEPMPSVKIRGLKT